MKYFVVADVHGFYDLMIKALTEKGYFEEKEPHKLVICGDLLTGVRKQKRWKNLWST